MTDAGSIDHRRYRRRILGWGLLVLIIAFAVPAVFAVRWVQDDLERRVPEALADVGVSGVEASFTGQDGTLRCETALADPGTAVVVAEDVYGVRTVDLDSSCLNGVESADDAASTDGSDGALTGDADGTDDVSETSDASDVSESSDASDASVASDTANTSDTSDSAGGTVIVTTTAPAPESTVPDQETIADVIAADPQFSQLSTLLQETGLTDTLGVGGPFTVLAPTDDAFDATFDAVGADAFQEFVSDEEQLRSVLLHHVAPGAIAAADFVEGPLTMLDGSTVDVGRTETGDPTFASGAVVATTADPAQLDIDASNGVIHAIDQVLPASVIDDGSTGPTPGLSIELGTGRIVMTGTVASQAQRGVLLSAAQMVVDDDDLLDELSVDTTSPVTDADADRAAAIVPTFPAQLLGGVISADADGVRLAGVVVDDDAETAVASLASEQGVAFDLSVREQAELPEDTEMTIAEVQDRVDTAIDGRSIEFEPDSTDLAAESEELLGDIASALVALDNDAGDGDGDGVGDVVLPDDLVIAIVGHTDSDGDADRNLLISEGRALRVREVLIELGAAERLLVAEGRGETEPVLDAEGLEDKDASRRVEFVVRIDAEGGE